MDLIKLTRELGAAIQQDERYLAFDKVRSANEADEGLNELMGKIQMVQMNYQAEAGKEEPDAAKMAAFEQEFNEAYTTFMSNENMIAYEAARKDIDDMMNYIMQILGLCVNGENPETCEPAPEEHSCGSDCSSCGGGCH